MRAHEAAALAVMEETWGDQVAYHGAGLSGSKVTAVRSDVPGDPFQGFSGKSRTVSFEINKSALPDQPSKQNRIVEANLSEWRVIDIADLSDIAKWGLAVERA